MRKFNEIVKGCFIFVQAALLLSNKKCEDTDNKNSQELPKDKKVTTKAIDLPGKEEQSENQQSQKPVREEQPENLEREAPVRENQPENHQRQMPVTEEQPENLERQKSAREEQPKNLEKQKAVEEERPETKQVQREAEEDLQRKKPSEDDRLGSQKFENPSKVEEGTTKYHDHLRLFVENQDKGNSGDNYEEVKKQLVAGNKTGHWIWYIFPQLPFGTTSTSLQFSISCLDEAKEYLADPVLSKRIEECTRLALAHVDKKSANEIFSGTKGSELGLDTKKFRSSMTLFALASVDQNSNIFKEAIDKFFDGKMDENTVKKSERAIIIT